MADEGVAASAAALLTPNGVPMRYFALISLFAMLTVASVGCTTLRENGIAFPKIEGGE